MIYELLNTGAENARSAKDLAKQLNAAPRDISKMIERERRAGRPICATCNGQSPGYFIAANVEEMERYCKQLYHRAGEIHKTRRACLKTLATLERLNAAE